MGGIIAVEKNIDKHEFIYVTAHALTICSRVVLVLLLLFVEQMENPAFSSIRKTFFFPINQRECGNAAEFLMVCLYFRVQNPLGLLIIYDSLTFSTYFVR